MDKGLKFKIPEYDKVNVAAIRNKLGNKQTERVMREEQTKECREYMDKFTFFKNIKFLLFRK